MGTRGAWGFRKGAQDKVTYNQFDSYPEGLGDDVVELVRQSRDNAQLAAIADGIVLVVNQEPPDQATIARYRAIPGLTNLKVSECKEQDWYCLLYGGHSQPLFYLSGATWEQEEGEWGARVKVMHTIEPDHACIHMLDGHDFLADSLFCEWAYIINLDTGMLEVYKGFNRDKSAAGRYAALDDGDNGRRSEDDKFYGVVFVGEIPLDEVRVMARADFLNKVKALLGVDDDEAKVEVGTGAEAKV